MGKLVGKDWGESWVLLAFFCEESQQIYETKVEQRGYFLLKKVYNKGEGTNLVVREK